MAESQNSPEKQVIEVNVKAADLVEKQVEIEDLKKQLEQSQAEKAALQEQIAKRPMATGTVPLPSSSSVNDSRVGYETYEEMMTDLRARENNGDPEAKAIINALWEKQLSNRDPLDVGKNPMAKEPLREQINALHVATVKKARGIA